MKKIKLLIVFAFIGLSCIAQINSATPKDSIDAINKKLDKIIKKQDSKIFKFGFSIGFRTFIESERDSRAIAIIAPDSTVFIEHGDRLALILSSSLTAFPFVLNKCNFLKNFGFTVNINMAEFTDNKIGSVFNKPIDGGMGFAYSFGPDKNFAIALTLERISVLRPTSFVINKEGQKIIDNGKAITSLDKTDNKYYINSGLNGVSAKFIYHFN
jgi:hypothetical protein